MVEFTSFKDAFIPLGLSCISFFHQIKVDEPLLHAATEFWILTWRVFQFNGVELCPTVEEFGAIMGEHDFSAIILLDEDLTDLAHQILGVPLAMAKRWCKSIKLNVFIVFKNFSKKDLSDHLNAFCLCILARFFLVHETPRMDLGILNVVKHLGSESQIAIILDETLNGLGAVHKEEATFFLGSRLLLHVWSLIFA